MTQDQFLELLNNWIRTNKGTSEKLNISADTELLGSGLLDSFDFLDLIVYIESKTGRKIDLAVADPSEFSVVRGLWSLALSDERPSANLVTEA
jgi:acyl carrier protein